MKTPWLILLLACGCTATKQQSAGSNPHRDFIVIQSNQQMAAPQLAIVPSTNNFTGRFSLPKRSITLAWNPDADAAEYNVYYGTASHSYSQLIPTLQPIATISALEWGVRYFFAVTAVNSAGIESDFSDEFSCTEALSNITAEASIDLQSWTACADCQPVQTNADRTVTWLLPIHDAPVAFYRLNSQVTQSP